MHISPHSIFSFPFPNSFILPHPPINAPPNKSYTKHQLLCILSFFHPFNPPKSMSSPYSCIPISLIRLFAMHQEREKNLWMNPGYQSQISPMQLIFEKEKTKENVNAISCHPKFSTPHSKFHNKDIHAVESKESDCQRTYWESKFPSYRISRRWCNAR